MEELVTFDDVLIKPKFSNISSRKDVDLSTSIKPYKWLQLGEKNKGVKLTLPVLSANMDTVTGPTMAVALAKAGGLGVLHRFGTIEQTVSDLVEVTQSAYPECAVSIGIGDNEKERAKALYNVKAWKNKIFVLDVAHGAQQQVVEQYKWLKENLIYSFVIVGNFATGESCGEFWAALNAGGISYFTEKRGQDTYHQTYGVDAFKIGIGPGSACTTRIKTGVGVPQLSAIIDAAKFFKDHLHKPLIIADGGMKTPGDIAKALAAGADCVMLGGMLAGTDETPGEIYENFDDPDYCTDKPIFAKKYRGSASKEAYSDQGKDASHRTAEGESFWIRSKGSVAQVLQDIEGGLRSAFTYVGAKNVRDFQEKAEFVRISANTARENGAHGKST